MLSKTLIVLAILIVAVRGTTVERCRRRKMVYEKSSCHTILEPLEPWESCCQPALDTAGSGGSPNMQNYESKVYTIKTGTFTTTQAYCDMDTDKGGWLTILRRTKSENTDFKKYEKEYLDGFGDLFGNFWLGLRTMHLLTKNKDCEMRVDLFDVNDTNVGHVSYDLFKVGDYPGFELKLGAFTASNNSLTDSLGQFHDQPFTVSKDRLDTKTDTMCAHGRGGWWYRNSVCSQQGSILTEKTEKLEWWVKDSEGEVHRQKYSKYEMKIRQKTCLSAFTDY